MRRVRGRHVHKRAKRGLFLWAIMLMITGLVLVAFPPVAKLISAKAAGHVATEYQLVASRVASEQFEAAVAANEAGDYESALELVRLEGAQAIARLRVPKIGVDLPVYPSSGDKDLKRGAGYLPKTALPVGGEGTHSAITAHSGMPTSRMFDRLPRLAQGDTLTVDVLGQTLTYEVTGVIVDTPEDGVKHLHPVAGRDQLTLVTCTPYGVNTHRLLVTAERIDSLPEGDVPSDQASSWSPLVGLLVGLVPMGVMAGTGWAIARSKRTRK